MTRSTTFPRARLVAWLDAASRFMLSLSLLTFVCQIGCGVRPDERPAIVTTETKPALIEAEPDASSGDAGDWLARAPKETWDAIYLPGKRGESKIGWSHTTIETTQENGETFVEISQESHLEVLRYRETTIQSIFSASREKADGTFLSASCRLTSDGAVTQTTNLERVEEGLRIERSAGGAADTAVIPFPEGTAGYYGIDRSLLSKPMEPGETRTIRYVAPAIDQVVEAMLKAVDYEETPLLQSRKEKLLRIEATQRIGAASFESQLWTNQSGETLKSFEPLVGQTVYRTTKEIAEAQTEPVEVDLGLDTVAPARLTRIEDLTQAIFDVKVAGSDAATIFPETTGQRVEALPGGGARIWVNRIRPDSGPADPGNGGKRGRAPGEADLASNAFLQSDDPSVQAFARSIAPDEQDDWKIAVALEKAVRETIENKNLSQSLLSAADVLKRKEGDCTEHAVLLAAALRVREIPSRIAIGLTYVPGLGGFAYHMWTEAWISDRWIPLDATTARGGTSASYLKLEDSSLAGASPLSAFLPAMRVLNRLQVETSGMTYDGATPLGENGGSGTQKPARPIAGPALPP
ncbi:MAG TPA: transglutaminase-like domain-containing protein [Pirellulaceae bacterium]|jgi:hypothetical protein|nr:transglutaminase-like domain-containing protein [Pirellulaceae bacterium]